MFENDALSNYLKSMEAQDKIMREFSRYESPVALAMKYSAIDKYENLSAARALRKASIPLGESDVMKVVNRKLSFLDSQVMIAIKQAQIPQLNQAFAAVDALSLASKKIAPQREWQQKMDAVLSPLTEQSAAFKLFHEQTTKLAQIFDPSVSAYLRKNVRTEFYYIDSINAVEAIYLKSFEELNGDIDDDISEQIATIPGLKETILDLGREFANEYLSDKFIVKLVTIIANKLGQKKSDVMFVAKIITLCLIIKTWIDAHQQSITDESQDIKIELGESKNSTQEERLSRLELIIKHQDLINQQEDAIKISKEALHSSLNDAIPEFESKLKLKFKSWTVKRYTLVAASFVDYLNEHTEYSKLEEITKVDIDNFVMDTQYDVLRNFDKAEIVNKLDSFLAHLYHIDHPEKGGVKSTK